MRINYNAGMQNSQIHMERLNQSLAKNKEAAGNGDKADKVQDDQRKDRVTIAKNGKAGSFLQNLMEQKQSITDRKNQLIGSTLEKGGSMENIQAQLEMYDQQLKNLDEQIAGTMKDEAEKKTEQGQKIDDKTPKTEAEMQRQKIANLSEMAAGIEQTEIIASVQDKLESEIRVLKSEVKLGTGATEAKIGQIAELESRARELNSNVNEGLAELGDQIQQENQVQPEPVSPEQSGLRSQSEQAVASDLDSVEKENLTVQEQVNQQVNSDI